MLDDDQDDCDDDDDDDDDCDEDHADCDDDDNHDDCDEDDDDNNLATKLSLLSCTATTAIMRIFGSTYLHTCGVSYYTN